VKQMQAQEMMTRSVITTSPDTSLAVALRLMHEHRIRHLPVVSGATLVGIVSERDLRSISPSPGTSLTADEITYRMGTTRVTACMTHDVSTIAPQTEVVQAARRILDGKFGCLPVVADSQLVGLVTEVDLLRAFLLSATPAGKPLRHKVVAYMHRTPWTARPDESVSLACQRMHEARIRHLPVVTHDNRLMGMITDRDIRQASPSTEPHMAAHELPNLPEHITLDEILTSRVLSVRGETFIADAGQLLLEQKVSCLPVVGDDNRLEGILTVTDLIRAYVGQHEARPGRTPGTAEAAAWYETFFDQHYLQGFAAFATPEITQQQVDFMVKTLNLPPHSAILDLGCGTGRHSLALGERGFQVVGVDLSEALLAVARREGEQRWFPIEFVQGDMRDLPYRNAFDAVLCYFSSFGYFSDADNRRVLTQVAQVLKDEGKFLLDVTNRDTALQQAGARRWWPAEAQRFLLEEVHYDARQSRFRNVWTLLQADGPPYVFPRMQFRAYALHELVALCAEVGLRVREVYGNEQRDAFQPHTSPRLILLAQKQDELELFET
jgi:CBS domain-containing protein/ubiquinone/menaquinone biosynthesis C-methylase UbiE